MNALYINSIAELNLKGSVKLFADDTTIFYFGTNFEVINQNMIHDLHIISDWLKYNKLSLNFSKSNFMYISKVELQRQPRPLSLFNSQIKYSTCIKFLGLYIDKRLTWKSHKINIKKKIAPFIGLLCKLKYHIPLKYLKLIYFSFIYSHLQYLGSIWFTACEKDLHPLKVLQNKAIKYIHIIYPTRNRLSIFTNRITL